MERQDDDIASHARAERQLEPANDCIDALIKMRAARRSKCAQRGTGRRALLFSKEPTEIGTAGRLGNDFGNREEQPMRSKLLVSTAALVAGLAVASAQNMPGGGGPSGGGQSGAAGQERQQSQSKQDRGGQAQQGAREQGRSQRSEGQGRQDKTTGQGQREMQGRQGQREQSPQGQAKQGQAKESQAKEKQAKEGQGKQGRPEQRGQRDQTTGQAQQRDQSKQGQAQQRDQSKQGQAQQREQNKQQGQSQPQRDQTTGQAPSRDQNQQGQRQNQPQRGQSQQGQAQQDRSSGRVTLSADQRTRIRQTVLTGSNVPRVNNVNFAIRVGTVVPSHVRIVTVPDTLIEIHPEWRGHSFFVVHDDIIIVDNNRSIVAEVPVGSSGASLDSRGGGGRLDTRGGGGGQAAVNLSSEEIVQMQTILIEQGFFDGPADGKFGPATRRAVIAFQQKQGFQATGRIDVQTRTALQSSGTSGQQGNRQGNQQGNQPSTTGQGGDKMQPPANQNMGAGQQGNQPGNQPAGQQRGNQPSTSGQGGDRTGGTQQNSPSGNQPSTSGQDSNRSANPDSQSRTPNSGGQAK